MVYIVECLPIIKNTWRSRISRSNSKSDSGWETKAVSRLTVRRAKAGASTTGGSRRKYSSLVPRQPVSLDLPSSNLQRRNVNSKEPRRILLLFPRETCWLLPANHQVAQPRSIQTRYNSRIDHKCNELVRTAATTRAQQQSEQVVRRIPKKNQH